VLLHTRERNSFSISPQTQSLQLPLIASDQDDRLIDIAEVHGLVQEAEENGHQHIFIYRPKSREVAKRCSNPDAVGTNLFGAKWGSRFPNYALKPNDFVWGDFRPNGTGSKGWTGKLYGLETRKQLKRHVETDNTYTAYYDKIEIRSVILIRWVHPGTLEIRVSQIGTKSDTKLVAKRDMAWDRIKDAVQFHDFEPWDLQPAMRKMVESQTANSAIYTLPSTRLIDTSSGVMELSAGTDEESLDDAPERAAAIKSYLENGCECPFLSVNWIHESASGMWGEKDLLTQVGKHGVNEILIGSTVNAQTVDYVTNHLRQFAK
jgi:hypothetical protein